MFEIKEQFIVDSSGNKTAVIIDYLEYQQILDMLEEFEDIKVFDKIKSENEELIPFDLAMEQIGL